MDLAAATDELYGIAPETFVARRTELVAEARAAGDRALAKQIRALRRPTLAAWLVNLLARHAAPELADLLALGKALREAQLQLQGAQLRQLSTQRHRAVDALARRAGELAADQGHPVPDAARQEVSQTLQAALADPQAAEQVRAGRVTSTISYGGFGGFELPGPPVAAPSDRSGSESPTDVGGGSRRKAADETSEPGEQHEPEGDRHDRAERERAEQERAEQEHADRVATLRTAAEQARAELDHAEAEAERATERADTLADEVERLRTQLREAEHAEQEARESARASRKQLPSLRQAVAEAERALALAEAEAP